MDFEDDSWKELALDCADWLSVVLAVGAGEVQGWRRAVMLVGNAECC